ncbi:nucleoside recognition protein [Neobacillus mesonae]|nr:nucleoside recognition protein [Neobacillus mesonae]
MNSELTKKHVIPPYVTTMILGVSALLAVAAVVSSPKEAFDASMQGLQIWWKMVFPALLPFIMLSQMLTALGFTHGLGVLLEPLMQKCFRLPGITGLGLAVGMTGGFPSGADTAARLYQQKHISGREAAVLASITHFASPMTLFVVIGAAFYETPVIGYILAGIHWFGGIIAGIILSRVAFSSKEALKPSEKQQAERLSLLEAMANAKEKDGRSFGRLLGDTVSHAVQVLMMTGGYMIIFSVLIKLLSKYVTPFLPDWIWSSFFEVHLGAYALRSLDIAAHAVGFALLCAAVSWGGLSSHLQASALLAPYGINTRIFTLGRLLHAAVSYGLVLLLWAPIRQFLSHSKAVFLDISAHPAGLIQQIPGGFQAVAYLSIFLVLLIAALIIISRCISKWQSIRHSSR